MSYKVAILIVMMTYMTACSTLGTILQGGGQGLANAPHSQTQNCTLNKVQATDTYLSSCQ